MQYSPKLKTAMEEIKAVLQKHDIAGIVVLHTPGFGEHLLQTNTSYSCAFTEGNKIRVKTDKNAPKEEKKKMLEDTANMLLTFSRLGDYIVTGCSDMLTSLSEVLDIVNTPEQHSSHNQQNN